MHILYFSFANLDRPNACQTHTLGVLAGLSQNGLKVVAVVPRPTLGLPAWPGLTYHFTGPYRGGRRHLPIEVLVSATVMLRLCLSHKFAAIYARDMDVFVGPRLCSQFFGIPLFLEIDDTPVEGQYPKPIRHLVELNLKRDYRQASGLIVPSVPRSRILVERFGLPKDKVHLVLNGTEESLKQSLTPSRAKEKLGLPIDSFCLGYVGTINDRYDFPTILAALDRARQVIPKIRFIIVGHGPCFAQVQRQVQLSGLENQVIFTGFVQQEKFPEILPALDLGLMNLTAEAAREHGPIHTKLATYGLFGLPVISAGFTLEGYPEEIKHSVFLIPPENPDDLAAMIFQLYRQPQLRRTAAITLHHYVLEKLTWKAVTADIIKIIRNARDAKDWSKARPL
jgi:glycosyltransferase involved in cell wall biosynthesis